MPSAAVFILTTSFMLFGCSGPDQTSSPTSVPTGFPNHSAEEIRSQILQTAETLQSYAATARVNVRSPEENRSFNADLQQRRADSLYMRFSLFGFEGGRMLLTSDSVFVYNARDHTLRVGPIADAQQFLPVPVQEDQIFENMLGLIAPEGSTDWSVEASASLYHLTGPNGRRRWTVDPTRWRVVRYTKERADGTMVEKRQFSNFQSIDGMLLPHQISFQRPADDLLARLNYEEIRLNPADLSFPFDVPADVPRRSLR